MMWRIQFVVENAGCPSCGERIRRALSEVAKVDEVSVDEPADAATVHLTTPTDLSLRAIDHLLRVASEGGEHEYRVAHESWTVWPDPASREPAQQG